MISLLLAAMLSATGDAEYLAQERYTLTAPQRAALDTFAAGWSTLTQANGVALFCTRGQSGRCAAIVRATMPAASAVTAEDLGEALEVESAGGGNVTVTRQATDATLTVGDRTNLTALLSALGSTAALATLGDFSCRQTFGVWRCEVTYRKIAAPATYYADKLAGVAVAFLRRVP